MTLPASGAIRMGADIGVETGNTSTSQISIGATAPRRWVANVASGPIRVAADFYGKTYNFVYTFTTSQSNVNLRNVLNAAGYNGVGAATVYINSGVYIWSSSTSISALDTGVFPSSLTIINDGIIMGCGGDSGCLGSDATAGGVGLYLSTNCTIQNNGYIVGGGGGAGGYGESSGTSWGGGGGAGGGRAARRDGTTGIVSFRSGGAIGQLGVQSTNINDRWPASGGRQVPGSGGAGGVSYSGYRAAGFAGGAGGGGGSQVETGTPGNAYGGNGGGAGDPGGVGSLPTGENFNGAAGGGGGYGASGGYGIGGSSLSTYGGAAGGKSVSVNGYTVSWVSYGTLYGSVS